MGASSGTAFSEELHLQEEPGSESQLICTIEILTAEAPRPAYTLIDTAASACFLARHFAITYEIDTFRLPNPKCVKLANGDLHTIELYAELGLRVSDHSDRTFCLITTLGIYDMILGMTWLVKHNPILDFSRKTVAFTSTYCRTTCLRRGHACEISCVSALL